MAIRRIPLPDSMRAFVEAQAAEEGYGSVSEHLRATIRDVQKRKARRELGDKLRGPS